MLRKSGFRSEIAEVMHDMVSGLERAKLIDKQTMRKFDERCFAIAPPVNADDIRALREREAVSQPVFAWYLNVSKNLVSDWERGVKKPGGPALRLLAIVKAKGLQALV